MPLNTHGQEFARNFMYETGNKICEVQDAIQSRGMLQAAVMFAVSASAPIGSPHIFSHKEAHKAQNAFLN